MASDNIRAALRNLYINLAVSLLVFGYQFMKEMLIATALTPMISRILFCAALLCLIGWILFLGHCCGELVRELQNSNYHYLWSFLPFFLPILIYLIGPHILSGVSSL